MSGQPSDTDRQFDFQRQASRGSSFRLGAVETILRACRHVPRRKATQSLGIPSLAMRASNWRMLALSSAAMHELS